MKKKSSGAGAAWEKNQEPKLEPLGEKNQEQEPQTNYTAPQPRISLYYFNIVFPYFIRRVFLNGMPDLRQNKHLELALNKIKTFTPFTSLFSPI